MNGQLFQTWVEQQLIPALDKINTKVVVIMDNAPYHSMVADKLPTLKSTKGQLQEWLTKKNIAYDESMTKKNIWNIIKPHLDAAKITRSTTTGGERPRFLHRVHLDPSSAPIKATGPSHPGPTPTLAGDCSRRARSCPPATQHRKTSDPSVNNISKDRLERSGSLWHYQRKVDTMAHTAQMYSEETEELKAQLENVSKKFAAKAKFVRNPAPAKTREERENAPYEVMRVYEGDSQPVFKWKIHFDGSTRDETAVLGFIQDVDDQMEILDITEHEVMHESDVRTWSDFCRKLRKELPPRDYEETDLERLKQFKQSSDESATIFIARFNHRAHFLPTALSNERKLEILRRNILPYYQEKLWDKNINTIQQLINYCDRLDDTRLSVEKFARGKAKTPNYEPGRKRTTVTCYRCGKEGHMSRECPMKQKYAKCGKTTGTNSSCPECNAKPSGNGERGKYQGGSVAAWLSEKVLRGRGPDARRNLRRAMDVCVCLLGADGRVVEGRINTLSATTARSARVRVPSGKGAHGCINVVVYVRECEVEWAWVAGESAPEPRRIT
ncbi:hypothetical protein GEV33_006145 [Tenebrio molitor]|uniref:CCHC-type domain-containing protein n=1 Tax=Tenebrio molitor TaxID=7067 RepID=A0A8J6HLL5_TENMO|nr:hypothetical protein GEV33_006145 [Tenebrio molitor]